MDKLVIKFILVWLMTAFLVIALSSAFIAGIFVYKEYDQQQCAFTIKGHANINPPYDQNTLKNIEVTELTATVPCNSQLAQEMHFNSGD